MKRRFLAFIDWLGGKPRAIASPKPDPVEAAIQQCELRDRIIARHRAMAQEARQIMANGGSTYGPNYSQMQRINGILFEIVNGQPPGAPTPNTTP